VTFALDQASNFSFPRGFVMEVMNCWLYMRDNRNNAIQLNVGSENAFVGRASPSGTVPVKVEQQMKPLLKARVKRLMPNYLEA
jgi:hypothetical protein